MTIDAQSVKELREKTGCGFMDCKAALAENDGDMDDAVDYLRKKGIASASKRAHRDTGEGLIKAFIAEDGKSGSLVEVNCETDFVARTEDFKGLVDGLLCQAAEAGESVADAEALLAQTSLKDPSQKVQDIVQGAVGKLGENIRFRRFARFACEGEGLVDAYIHPGNKIGVLIEMSCDTAAPLANDEFRVLVKDLAMQVAAASPSYLVAEDIPAEEVDKEKEILLGQARESGKPEQILDKIVAGRIGKYFEEVCLLEQKFVKDGDRRVKDVIGDYVKKLGENVKVTRFQRYQLGRD